MMSVLLIEEAEHVRRRWMLHEQEYHLLDWFTFVEGVAWKFVDQYHPFSRLDKIFLIQGQLLTSEYAISHRCERDLGCLFTIEADAQIPEIVDDRTLIC